MARDVDWRAIEAKIPLMKGGIGVISKNQFCKMMIQKFEKSEEHSVRESDILSSSVLAVAMEHLGLLKSDDYKQYASERGGVLYTYWDFDKKGIAMLSMREMLELLPDEV